MEYNINDFVDRLRTRMYSLFPFEKDIVNVVKHPNRVKHIRDVAFKDNEIQYVGDNMLVFDIGNDYAEKYYPYYHILEDAPVIRKKGKGTDKSKGSQANITNLSARDYGIVSFNGKTFSKEYSKNVRVARRKVIDNSSHIVNGVRVNRNSDTYQNRHYHYIENMLSAINPLLAEEFNMKLARTQSSGLAEEYIMDDNFNLPSIDFDTVSDFVQQIIDM